MLLRQQRETQWVESMQLTCSHGSGVTYSATQSLDPGFRKLQHAIVNGHQRAVGRVNVTNL